MSQHQYSTRDENGVSITVIMGYDRPLDHYFLLVEVDGLDDPIYCNLYDTGPFNRPLEYYRDKLDELGLSIPSGMFAAVERDRRENIGNKRVIWSDDGIKDVDM